MEIGHSSIAKVLMTLMGILTLKVVFLDIGHYYPSEYGNIKQYEKDGSRVVGKASDSLGKVRTIINEAFEHSGMDIFNRGTFRIVNFQLFNSHHIFGLYLYRIILFDEKGVEYEPFKVFNSDLSPGPFSKNIFSTRYPQALMYPIGDMVRTLCNKSEEKISEVHKDLLINLFNYCKKLSNTKTKIKYAELKIIPMDVPTEFVSNHKPWLENEWRTIVSYYYNEKSMNYMKPRTLIERKVYYGEKDNYFRYEF